MYDIFFFFFFTINHTDSDESEHPYAPTMQFSQTNKQRLLYIFTIGALFFVSRSSATAVTLGNMVRNTQLKTNRQAFSPH